MKFAIQFAIIIFLFDVNASNAQAVHYPDSTKSVSLLKKSILPMGLMGVGVLVSNSDFERRQQMTLRNRVGNDFEFRIDNYIQYAPIVELYIADIAGVKAKNHWFDQTKYLFISNLISATITHGLKQIIDKPRPNGGHYSFPSGHTTFAFTNATVLFREFRDTAPLFAYSGYAFAATTGTLRMLNNKHWLSDVLFGAGVGILSAELVYHFEPFKNFNPFKRSKDMTFVPRIGAGSYGFYFSYGF